VKCRALVVILDHSTALSLSPSCMPKSTPGLWSRGGEERQEERRAISGAELFRARLRRRRSAPLQQD
jgi:hypothetical protein